MLIKRKPGWALPHSAVTPEAHYANRRQIMAGLGASAALAGSGLALSGCGEAAETGGATGDAAGGILRADTQRRDLTATANAALSTDEPVNAHEAVTGYNNFFEFGTDKGDPARYADALTVDPWSVEVSGLTDAPGRYGLDELIDFQALEQRIYRLRCVEAWSMVIPWIGVPLAGLIDALKPQSAARYVRFETVLRPDEMRGVGARVLDWPYVEGLRLDEARNELAFIAVGLYGEVLPKQNGAPLRLVVPWKYGFKSIKSIAAIRFTETMPMTSWHKVAPGEYGFYANVNPEVSHPRWSQARERRIGEFGRRDTVKFNGYGPWVADLYDGMDLTRWY
ncbi:sulfoxide reductase catalytic subunit YedY [Rhodothalassium salexigens DSM 2132]|uniref:Protein-methionine-sulfoxide reductase catalytic subunit MsrP n=1 Tax=Rhodothalassium salexigens DSM 2132 TaxID=1188247 RepID=A0A4R2PE18_RHOSA|nr:protein-methionine-sulfoxide reductase catalytic subunit MsrP [Rhodothalassium salexigens]MBB4211926.1 sulfoxide reductase catalytic subunit YedY [Rhodothalassium salexigens DSM 2132]MBK1639266.1 mononuclear molybdenum enzyme YedY [Rhodothalassium salexigens DSM 2132]TCP33490.1 sulfoxide reductase catalytic subunit YedY [Rhodothalassium salexigens DSM 2132]